MIKFHFWRPIRGSNRPVSKIRAIMQQAYCNKVNTTINNL